jgi:hypothetical protein
MAMKNSDTNDCLERMLVHAARVEPQISLQRLWGFNDKAWEECEKLRAGTISSGLFLNKALIRKILQRSSNAQILEKISPHLSPREEWEEVFVPDELYLESCEVEESIVAKVRLLSLNEKRLIDRMLRNLS